MKKTEQNMKNQDQRYLEIKNHANLADLEEIEAKSEFNFLTFLVIPIDADWKSYFDMIMLLCACENTIMQAYYSAFGLPDGGFENILDYVIEGLFLMDLIFCLCQQYRDAETQTMVSDIKVIAINYLKGNFLFDLIAIIPFDLFTGGQDRRLYRLLKMLRVPRMI